MLKIPSVRKHSILGKIIKIRWCEAGRQRSLMLMRKYDLGKSKELFQEYNTPNFRVWESSKQERRKLLLTYFFRKQLAHK